MAGVNGARGFKGLVSARFRKARSIRRLTRMMPTPMAEIARNLQTLFQQGGPVLWVLLGLSIVSLTLCAERAMFWRALHRSGRRAWVSKAVKALKSRDTDAARAMAAADATLYGEVVSELISAPVNELTAVGLIEERRDAIERFNGALSTIITAGPLVGLLGTVTGIIRSFDVIGNASAVRDIPAVAQGVSEALLNTAAGLAVALLTLLPYVIYRSQADRCLSNIESLTAAAARGQASQPAK